MKFGPDLFKDPALFYFPEYNLYQPGATILLKDTTARVLYLKPPEFKE